MTLRERRPWSLFVGLVAVALIVAACQAAPSGPAGSPTPGAEAPDPNGELIGNAGTEPDTIDPHKASFDNEIQQVMSVFEGLMTLEPATLKPVPAQAAKLPDVSADGKTWTYTLRDGLKFSDGTPLTAADFVRGFTRTCTPPEKDYASVLYVIEGCEKFATADPKKGADLPALKAAVGIKAVGDKQIQFTLSEAAGYMNDLAYMWVGMPIKQESLDKGGEDKWTEPATYIGNGPFILKEWKHNEKFVYEANPNYWRGKPKLAKWTRLMIAEQAVAFAAYKNNELDVHGLTAETLRSVSSDPDLQKQVQEGGFALTQSYSFNVTKPPFNDINVRQAFSKAFDREAFVRDVVVIGKVANGGWIPPGIPGYDEGDTSQKFDVTAAKALLDKASPEAKAALNSVKLTYSSTAVEKTRAEFAAQQWTKNLGVNITLDPVDPSAYSKLFKGGAGPNSPQLFRLGWIADFPDQFNWFPAVWGPKNGLFAGRTGYKDQKFTDLIDQAEKERDAKKRDDLYIQASRLLSQDAPGVWLYYGAVRTLVKPWVHGYSFSTVDSTFGEFKQWELYVTKKTK